MALMGTVSTSLTLAYSEIITDTMQQGQITYLESGKQPWHHVFRFLNVDGWSVFLTFEHIRPVPGWSLYGCGGCFGNSQVAVQLFWNVPAAALQTHINHHNHEHVGKSGSIPALCCATPRS